MIRNHVQEVHANIGSKNVRNHCLRCLSHVQFLCYTVAINCNVLFQKETVLRKFDVPDYVINHGIVNISTLMDLFQGSKVFRLICVSLENSGMVRLNF